MRRLVHLLVSLALCGASAVFAQAGAPPDGETRVALVIGNSSYRNSPLKNPANDARDMAARLRTLGFNVIERNNLTARQIGATLREFRSALAPGSVALIFYAGHGLQIRGENYLPAVDADISSEEDVPQQSLAVRQLMDVLDDAKTRLNLLFLDACRNNPYARSFRSASDGLARVNAPSGTLISFATRPGGVAADGEGANGLYTSKLLEQMGLASQPIEQVLKRVVSGVRQASGGRQEPWMEGSIEGDFCFGGCGQAAAPATSAPDPATLELAYWNGVRDSRNPDEVQAYLDKYPRGEFATLAAARLRGLKEQASAQARPAAPETGPRANIYIFRRSKYVASLVDDTVVDRGRMVGILGSGSYLYYQAPAGDMVLSIDSPAGSAARTFSVEGGRTYYVEVTNNMLSPTVEIRMVDEPDGTAAVNVLKKSATRN